MKKSVIFYIIIMISLFTGCQQSVDLEDFVHVDINYTSSNDQSVLIESITDTDLMSEYYTYLFINQPVDSTINSDLNYHLSIRTPKKLLTYVLSFDFDQQLALATNEDDSFSIPFDWVNHYLTIKPLPNQFTHLQSPSFNLFIDEHTISLGVNQKWSVNPTTEVTYENNYHTSNYEIYTLDSIDYMLTGSFSHLAPDRIDVLISTNDTPILYENVQLDQLPKPTDSGNYSYTITAYWEHPENGYNGQIDYTFELNIQLPTTYTLNTTTYEPGDCMAILIENPIDLNYRIETETYDRTIGLFYHQNDLVGLIPLDSRTTPGDYNVKVYRSSSNILLDELDYSVIYKEFETQQLTISSSTASLKSQENSEKDAAKFGDAKTHSVGEKLWEGTFLLPVEGRISTEYSVIRYVNESTESSRHSGIDIAVPQGTPIKAANNGIITFSSDLIISGNVVVIDHGYGLFSSYVHLHKIYVEDGQEVKKGDIIGEVGTTGYSTGPHLHWSIWKNGVFLNPWRFIDEDPLAFLTTD